MWTSNSWNSGMCRCVGLLHSHFYTLTCSRPHSNTLCCSTAHPTHTLTLPTHTHTISHAISHAHVNTHLVWKTQLTAIKCRFPFLVCVFVRVCWGCMVMRMLVCACTMRPEVHPRCHSPEAFTLCFETGLFIGPELTVWLTGQHQRDLALSPSEALRLQALPLPASSYLRSRDQTRVLMFHWLSYQNANFL